MDAEQHIASIAPHWSLNELQAALDEHAIVSATDPSGRISYVNDHFCEVSKYTRQELIGKDHRILNSGFHPKSFFAEMWDTISSGHTWRGEFQNQAKDGSLFWIYSTLVPLFDEQGHTRQYVAISADISDRKNTEERLHASQMRFRQLAESIPQMNFTCDEQGNCDYLSPQWLEFTGQSERAQLGPGWLSRIHPEERGTVLHRWHLMTQTRKFFEAEFRIRRFDGIYRWFRTRAAPQTDERGRVIRWFGTCMDIDDLRESQTKLVQAHAKGERNLAQLQAVLDNISEGVVAADLRGNVFHWNRAAMESHGFADLRECQRCLPDFAGIFELRKMSGEKLCIDDWPLSRVFRGETLRGVTLRLRRIDRNWERIFSYGGSLARDAAGKPFLAVVSMADVTERHLAELALRKSEASFRQLADAMPQMVWTARPDGHHDYYNRRWYEYTGFPEGAEPIESWDPVLHPDDTAMCERVWQTSVKTGQPYEIEYRFLDKKTGEYRWHLGRALPVRNEDGEIVRWYGTCTDIHELKRTRDEVQAMNDTLEQRVELRTRELEAANKELEAFSYSVSHDLRSPLRAMDGFSQAIIDDYGDLLPAEGIRYLQIVRGGAQKMGALIDDLLSFSRLSRAPMNRSEVDMEKLVFTAFEDLGKEAEGRKIEHRIGGLPCCQGDPVLLKQVWINLLSNALKYTRERSPAIIEVDAIQQSGMPTVYYVRDNGTGFDMKYAGKLFGVFQRLHRAEEYEGTGVGLAIVQRIIHRHGGNVWAEAEVDRGAGFYFTVQ